MSLLTPLSSRLRQRRQQLPAPITRDVAVQHDLRVPMRDGAVLLADRWAPRVGGAGLPVALVRSPYGRAGAFDPLSLAERGYQVIGQSVRGTFGSDGPFDAVRQEREDGLDTIDWVMAQPWFGGSIVLAGMSYLGLAQWAVAADAPPAVTAMIPAACDSALTLEILRADGFSLETAFLWGVQVAEVSQAQRRLALPRVLLSQRRYQRAMSTLPLQDADVTAIGRRVDYVQNALAHHRHDPFWAPADHSGRVGEVSVPVSMVAGWYDLFLPGQLRDHAALQQAGRAARLTIGPWTHVSPGVTTTAAHEALDFGLALARGQEPPERAPVRLFVMGQDAWRDVASWPPPGYARQRFHLQPAGALGTAPPPASPPDGYRYDPADPTPAVGGVRSAITGRRGRVDNRVLERREDVLTYTTPVLADDVEVIGEVSAEVWFRSSRPHADLFIRLCDVDGKERSWNVCDGLTSVTGADRTTRVRVDLWPTAHRFQRGHRIRVQISSGAFPRYNRNPGTGEPRGTAVTMHAADQQVLHDPDHPSAILLPVQSAAGPPTAAPTSAATS